MILFFVSFALRPRLIYILNYVHWDKRTVYRIFGKEDTGRGVSSRCLTFNISSHKVSPNSKGWANLKKRGNWRIYCTYWAYPFSCRRLFVRRSWYLGIYSQTLYVLFRYRRAQASINKTAGGIDFKRRGVPPSLSRVRIACVRCSQVFERKKKTTSVNRLEDKKKQHVQFYVTITKRTFSS